MYSSAIASSSAVEIPGRTCSPTNASVSATTRPARAICSTSWVLLRMIIATLPCGNAPVPPVFLPGSRARGHLVERLPDLGEDLLDGPVGVDPDHVPPRRAVVVDERSGLLVVELEPAPDRLRRVVRAVLLRGALHHPLDQGTPVGNLELEHDVQGAVELAEQLVERLRLRHRAGEPVEDESRQRVPPAEAVADHPDHQAVVDELTGVVDGLHLATDVRVELLHLPDHVAGGDVRDPVGLRDQLRLGPLAGP